MKYVFVFLLGLVVTFLLTPLVIRLARRIGMMDAPDERRIHTGIIPRGGGLAVFIGFHVACAAVYFVPWTPFVTTMEVSWWLKFLPPSVFLVVVGVADDRWGMQPRVKLGCQIVAALGLYAGGVHLGHLLYFPLPWPVDCFLTVLWCVGFMNAFNLIDGLDGLAAGLGIITAAGVAGSMLIRHLPGDALVLLGLMGACLGFLRYNFPPARIYLGDGGAYFLGFLIGIMTIVSSQKGTVVAAMMAPLFVLALPILDTTLAIVRRGVQGLPVFRPDRRHIHHRLLETGVPQRTIVLGVYAFTAVFLGLGFVAFWSKGMWIPNLLGLGLLVVLLLAGRLNFSREWFAVGRVLGNSLSMRQEVQYALSLTNWIVLSSPRAASLDDLWEDFVFAARKLGFSYARIQLEDGERVWERPGTGGTVVRREMLRSPFGTLELGAVQVEVSLPENLIPAIATVPGASLPVISDHVFEITGELLAEGWLKAVRRWSKLRQLPPRFGSSSGPAKALPFPVEQSVSDSGNQPV
jgi:UDP-GlcNAc:undecaprenyl-phosphate GlcNAc-1-phosphate transferase